MSNPIELTNKISVVERRLLSGFPLRRAFLFIALTLAAVALLPTPKAFGVSPPPDGGYPNHNTAEGTDALFSLTTGLANTAIGFKALHDNTTGGRNTAVGDVALSSNTTGGLNTAIGDFALSSNTIGNANTANGFEALAGNTTGGGNTATGESALLSNTTGDANTATGERALQSNTTGFANTAIGLSALVSNTTGGANTAIGVSALENNPTGSFNIALGAQAGIDVTKGNNNIHIGSRGKPGDSNTIRIGKKTHQKATFIAGISGATIAGGVGVIIDADGHLGTIASSARSKEDIKPMDKASEAILALRPVTFRYREDLDPKGIAQFGLVAEQVEKVNPNLVARDEEGNAYTVRYEAVNTMLLNEFLKEHRTVQKLKAMAAKQETTIAQQQKDFQAAIAQQQKQIEILTAGLQKMSSQIGVNNAAPQAVARE
jgi:hypothetical protein